MDMRVMRTESALANVYYLDANICIFHMRKPFGVLADKIASIDTDSIKIPAIVKAELLVGAEKSKRQDKTLAETLAFCEPYEIVPFDDFMVRVYARIRALLESTGQKIGWNDTIIAATVLARNGTLITNNISEFGRIDGLQWEDWTKE